MSQFVSSNRPTTKLQSMLQNYSKSGKKLQSKKFKSEGDICYLFDRNFFCKRWYLSLLQMLGGVFSSSTQKTPWIYCGFCSPFHSLLVWIEIFVLYYFAPVLPYMQHVAIIVPHPHSHFSCYVSLSFFLVRLNVNLGSRTDKSGDGTEV